MKKILIAAALGAIGAATGATAQAADLAVKAPVYKAPIAKAYDWTGFYFGVNGGVGLDRSYTGIGVAGVANPASRLGGLGAVGGGQVGYNWQYGDVLGLGSLVLGVEADIQGSGMRDNSTCVFICASGTAIGINQTLDWFGTARARVGFATGPVLTYVTGGFAYGDVKTSAVLTTGGASFPASASQTRTGWTIGSGVEAALGGNWTAKLEYLYIDLGSQGAAFATPTPVAFSSDIREHIFRVGLNYRLGANGVYAPEPVYRWTGFYGGINVGSATAFNHGGLTNNGVPGPVNETFNVSPDGYAGGGQIGYNWQSANWVVGVEGDFQGSSQRDDKVCELECIAGAPALSAAFDQKMQWFGTARARVGYSVGSTLFYVTGGFAYGDIRTRISGNFISFPYDATFNQGRAGYAVGGGIETPLRLFASLLGPNWTIKTEYLYVDLGRVTDTFAVPGTPLPVNLTYSTRVQEQIFRTGINYHFNQPVVAKY